MTSDQQSATNGVTAVRGLLADWQAARAELRAIEEAEHPAFTDRFGRVWTWMGSDTWHHDDTLAYPRDMIESLRGLPPESLRANPNYHKLCEVCRSGWTDASPISPRVLLGDGWYDVRDGKTYAGQEQGAALAADPGGQGHR